MKIEITGILMIYEEEILESRTSRQKTESKHSLRSEIPGKHKCRPDTYCIRQFENGTYYNVSLAVSSRYRPERPESSGALPMVGQRPNVNHPS